MFDILVVPHGESHFVCCSLVSRDGLLQCTCEMFRKFTSNFHLSEFLSGTTQSFLCFSWYFASQIVDDIQKHSGWVGWQSLSPSDTLSVITTPTSGFEAVSLWKLNMQHSIHSSTNFLHWSILMCNIQVKLLFVRPPQSTSIYPGLHMQYILDQWHGHSTYEQPFLQFTTALPSVSSTWLQLLDQTLGPCLTGWAGGPDPSPCVCPSSSRTSFPVPVCPFVFLGCFNQALKRPYTACASTLPAWLPRSACMTVPQPSLNFAQLIVNCPWLPYHSDVCLWSVSNSIHVVFLPVPSLSCLPTPCLFRNLPAQDFKPQAFFQVLTSACGSETCEANHSPLHWALAANHPPLHWALAPNMIVHSSYTSRILLQQDLFSGELGSKTSVVWNGCSAKKWRLTTSAVIRTI